MGIFDLVRKTTRMCARRLSTERPSQQPSCSPLDRTVSAEPGSPILQSAGAILARLDSLEDSLKSHVSTEASRVSAEMAETFAAELRCLTVILETLPQSTRQELEPLLNQLSKSRTPIAVRAVSEQITRKVSAAISDMIDNALLNVLREKGRVTNDELVSIAQERNICSRPSVFRHLKRLEAAAKIEKIRDGRTVYYSLNESQVSSISQPDTSQPIPDTSH